MNPASPASVLRPQVAPEAASSTRTTQEELIARDVLFGNPEYASPSLSPDGKSLQPPRARLDGK